MANLPSRVIMFMNTITLTNSPLAVREIAGSTSWRVKLDLDAFTMFRAVMNVATAGAAGADVHFEGSTDGTNFTDLNGAGGPEIAINSTGAKDTGWAVLAPALRAENVYVRMMEKDGDGVADPVLRQVYIMFSR